MGWFDFLCGLVLLHAIMAVVAVTAGILSRRQRVRKMAAGLMLAVCLMQTGVVAVQLVENNLLSLPRAVYMHGLAWLLAVLSLVLWRTDRLPWLAIVLMPFALVTVLSALFFEGHALPHTVGSFFSIHVVCVFAALVCMAVACGAGIFFLVQERSIKSKEPLTGFRRDLPALSRLDTVNSFATLAGFPLFSLGLLFGMVSARMAWGSLLSGDPKELVSLFIWGVYAFLFHQRLAKGWRGRKPAILAVVVFALAACSLFIVNTLMITHHSFMVR